MQKSLLLLSLFFSWFIVQAQQKENEDASIVIQSAKIKIHSTVYIATTVVELELYNPNGKIMDGTVEFSLNEGQVINKFKLDVDGSMRDGVVIEKQQARVAYENIIRRRVDPGLLEQTAPNQYRIRVYPMPAKGKRYVSFGVQELLMQKKQQADYLFPLSFVNTVKQIEVDITVASAQNPFTSSGLLQGKTFGNVPNKQLNFNSNSISNKDFLLFSIPLSNAASVCQYTNDECDQPFFGRVTPNDLPMSKSAISQVTVFWDVSSSGERRDIEKEIGFLEAYLKKYHPTAVHLVTFAIDIVEERRFDLPTKNLASIKRFLRQQKMDGGTRLNKIYCKKYPADEYLLFSDGQTTFGNGGLHTADQPVFAIYSTAPANVALLDEIAGSTGGKTINLVLLDIQDAILSLDKPQWNPLVSKEKLNQFELQIVGDGESFLIKGINKSNADSLVIDFFYAGQIQKVSIPLRFGNCVEEGLSEAALLLNWQLARKNKLAPDSLHSIATDLNAVSPSTSLIVLETLEDYYQFKITPPKDLLNEFKKRYPSLPDKKGISQSDKDILVYNKLTQSVNEYNKKIAWWDPHMTAISLKPYTEKNFSPAATANIENKESDDNGMDRIGTKSSELSQVVVVGYGTQRRRAATGSVSKISTSELTSNGTVQSALQGRVSGLSITGDYNSVHVRGTTSIRGANEPMYILDSVPIDATTAMTMPTSNIASITIVKDATASAIYGSRAANGVIIIETKRAPLSYSAPVKEDAKQEIIDSFEALSNSVTYDRYIEMKKYKKNIPAFYFTMAAYFYKHKQPKEALRILSNLAVIQPENHQLLRTIGYVLEEWNDYDNATEIYEMVLAIKEEEPQSYRDLALSYAFNGNQQEAFKLLYKGLSKDWGLYENRYNGLREIMMTELNILAGKEAVKATNVDTSLLKLLPVDLRIVIDWNKDETDIDLHIKEPGGEQSSYNNKVTKSGGRLSNDFTQGYGPEVYEIKNAKKGVYEVKINYYGDRYQKEKLPSFIKLTVFKNYGRPNQTVTIKTVLLDDDEGMIDLAEVKF